MFKILDGRTHFFQWDFNQKLIVEDSTINEVHYCNRTDDCSLVVEVKEENGLRVADVPNILLQDYWKIRVYAFCTNHTKVEETFDVVKRSKPADYAYTEEERVEKLNSNKLYTIDVQEFLNKKYNGREILTMSLSDASMPVLTLSIHLLIAEGTNGEYINLFNIPFEYDGKPVGIDRDILLNLNEFTPKFQFAYLGNKKYTEKEIANLLNGYTTNIELKSMTTANNLNSGKILKLSYYLEMSFENHQILSSFKQEFKDVLLGLEKLYFVHTPTTEIKTEFIGGLS